MAHDETQKVGTSSDVEREPWRVLRTAVGPESHDPPDSGVPDDDGDDGDRIGRNEPMKRLNLNVPASVFRELQTLAKSSGRSMTELIRFALGLLHFVITEVRGNRRLAVTDSRGRVVKEVVLPW
ncbi:MAG TPA: hypothetical protein VF432_10645 [Thermoanaerobaculia bacterium]